jgi:hypothetical protein
MTATIYTVSEKDFTLIFFFEKVTIFSGHPVVVLAFSGFGLFIWQTRMDNILPTFKRET